MKQIFCALTALIMLLCAASLSAADVEVDEEGGVWDYDAGTYTAPDGAVYSITNEDGGGASSSGASSGSSSSSSSSGAITVASSDGSEDPTAGLQKNPDGSVTVESGQISAPDDSEGTGQHLTPEEYAARWAKYSARNGSTTGTVYMDPYGNIHPVEIKTLGLGRSLVVLEDGEKQLVPTASILWDTEAPEDKVLAVATPSKQSYISIYAKSSKSSFKLAQVLKCRVLRVIRVGKNWTFVDDAGVRGYVLTSAITFYSNAPKQYVGAMITVKGKTPRGNYVHYRTSPSRKAKQSSIEYPVGTLITVFSLQDGWYEIDLDGYHCYMAESFVTLENPLPLPEEPEPVLAELEPAPEAEAEP